MNKNIINLLYEIGWHSALYLSVLAVCDCVFMSTVINIAYIFESRILEHIEKLKEILED